MAESRRRPFCSLSPRYSADDAISGGRVSGSSSIRRAAACAVVGVSLVAVVDGTSAAADTRYGFADVTESTGLGQELTPNLTWGSLVVDYDLDGDVDLFVNHHWHLSRLYINGGATFQKHSSDFAHVEGYEAPDGEEYPDRHACAWGEANGDGAPDLYCTQGADKGIGSGPNQLLLQVGDTFVDAAGLYGVSDLYGRGRTVNWIDFDGDNDLDLFVGNKKRAGHPNVMFRNDSGVFERARVGLSDEVVTTASTWSDWDSDGDPDLLLLRKAARPLAYKNNDGQFRRRNLEGLPGGAWNSGTWGDYDGDGRADLFLARLDRAAVLRNLGNRFRIVYGTGLRSGRTGEWLDADNDGDLDLFVVQGASGDPQDEETTNRADFLVLRRRNGFERVRVEGARGATTGNGEAAAVADFDRDGLLDVFVTNGHDPKVWRGPSVLLRNHSTAGSWAALELYGGPWNPLAFGARLRVKTAFATYRRELTDGVGYRSQSEVGHVHLGLGDALGARVRVTWPGGRNDCVTLRAGTINELARGSSPCG
jgi:hypothetical protein